MKASNKICRNKIKKKDTFCHGKYELKVENISLLNILTDLFFLFVLIIQSDGNILCYFLSFIM